MAATRSQSRKTLAPTALPRGVASSRPWPRRLAPPACVCASPYCTPWTLTWTTT